MKLYKLSILALALAGTMAACSDDNYDAPAATPGAFFPVESPDMVVLPFDGNSVEITMRRNTPNIPSDETFKLSVDDPSGLFNIPSTVTFTGHEVTAPLTVTFDPAAIETDKEYPVTITIEGAANKWGITTYSFVFDRKTPLNVTNIGEGLYIYTQYLSGGGYYDCVKTVNPLEPNIEVYTIDGWFDYPTEQEGIPLNLTVHTDIILPNGYPYVELPWTTLKFVNTNYAAVKVISYLDYVMWRYGVDFDFCAEREFELALTDGTVVLTPDMLSYFDTDRGVFNLYNLYGAFDETDTYLGSFGSGYEYFYLPGYPDYDVEINYLGYFTNADDEITAMGELYAGEDVETVDVYNVAGDDVQAAIEAILNGEIEGETITPESTDAISVKFSVPGAGTYTMIAIANGNGEAQGVDYATYTIAGAGAVDTGNWKSLGEGILIDAWVCPAFQFQNGEQVNPYNYPINVEIEQNLDVEGEYRMVSPYTSENFLLVGNNGNTKATNIVFNIADPDYPYVPFQYSGFNFDGANEKFWIADANWYIENVLGISPEDALADDELFDLLSYYESGVLEVMFPTFGLTSNGVITNNPEDLGRRWKGGYTSQIVMPTSAKAATAAKAIRKMVSSDNFIRNAKAISGMDNVGHKGSKRNQPVTMKKKVMLTPATVSQLR